jgi:D-alanyl-D-alanine carboxypeptidase/D-alanyl-D-alanine-endopeptidase (penicillin-binding protein 4)
VSRERSGWVAYHCWVTDEQPISRRAAREAAAPASRRGSRSKPAKERQAPDAGGEKPRGIGALFAKHPTTWLAGAIAVVFVLLGTGAVFAGVSVGSAAAVVPSATPTPEPPRDVPEGDLAASRLRTCSIAGLAADPRLMALSGYVVRVDNNEVLFDRAGTTPARTASVLKLLTAAAALTTLGPDFQIRTSVYPGSQAGSIVLVGRGDATLSRLPGGQESVYKGAPKLADLAAQVLANYDGEITNIVLDANYWSPADKWDPAWKRSEQTQGYHSEVTALQVDGDRANPAAQDSPRSTDPIGRAGQWFLEALRAADTENQVADNVTITTGSAVNTSTVLGEVASQPLRVIIPHMLLVSDNTMAEMLARITSKESSLNGSAASLQQAIPSALTNYGISGVSYTIKDGSGLSEFNAVPPSVVTQLMIAVNNGAFPELEVVRAGLPVAGQSGTLAGRFTGANAVARGHVFAKTGWIDTSYSLGGLVQAADGTVFAFAFYAIGDGIQSNARAALDTLTTGVFTCGDNLSNN